MKDYICIDIESNLTSPKILDLAVSAFPEFKWHSGDSDSQGAYVFGANEEDVQVQIWLGEQPITMSISFRNVSNNAFQREDRKGILVEMMRKNLIPSIGRILKFDA